MPDGRRYHRKHMARYRIALVPGDHAGPEVTAPAHATMALAAARAGIALDCTWFPWGADHYRETGSVMPPDGLDTLRTFDAIYLGAMGDPARLPDRVLSWGFTQPVRKRFRQYVNVRPARLRPGVQSPLANPGAIDLVVVRENAEGEYTNIGGNLYADHDEELAIQTAVYTRRGIERVVRHAFDLARTRRRHVTSISKANALPFGMVLWDDIFAAVARDYPDVATRRLNVDAAAMFLIQRPADLDVVACTNLFGDILSDAGAAITGGVGLAPGANLNPDRQFPSMFEPIHGSAPDIGGQGIANPIAAILAGALLLRHVANGDAATEGAADAIERAVGVVLASGQTRTRDLGGIATTAAVGDAVCAAIESDTIG